MSDTKISVNININKKIILTGFVGLFIFLFGHQLIQAQQEAPLIFDEILSKLKITSQTKESLKKLNEQLIKDVRMRRVDFDLTLKNKKALTKVGGNYFLIKAINENSPKYIEAKAILYRKFTDNYNGTIEQKKIALEAAQEYMFRYGSDQEDRQVIDYFRETIPKMQRIITEKTDCKCN